MKRLAYRVSAFVISLARLAILLGMTGWASGIASLEQDIPLGLDGEEFNGASRDALRLSAARGALAGGFPHLVRQLLPPEADRPEWSPEYRRAVMVTRLRAKVALGDFALAENLLRDWPFTEDSGVLLLETAVAYGAGDLNRAFRLLEQVDYAALDQVEKTWYHLFNAHRMQAAGELDLASEEYERASELSPSPVLRANFEIIRLRQELQSRPPSETVISGLRESTRSLQGEVGGFEAARLLAVALAQTGRAEEAVQLIDRHLQQPGLERTGLRPQFLLLMGLIAGEQTGKGQLALTQLIGEGAGGRRVLEPALQLLARTATEGQARVSLLGQLGEWLDSPRPHPLRDQMLALRAYIHVSAGVWGQAEGDALMLMESFAESPLVSEALRLLAYSSWHRDPPRYRTAAGYLNRLRQRLEEGEERALLGVLMADGYFLNGDYVNASDAYGSVEREPLDDQTHAEVVYQRILSEIRAGRPERAERLVDDPVNRRLMGAGLLWMAEWNLMDAMRAADGVAAAYARVERLLGGPEADAHVDLSLRVRMKWLRIQLTLEGGDPAAAARRARQLMSELDEAPTGRYASLGEELKNDLASHLLLVEGEAMFAGGDSDGGRMRFQELRDRHPESGPALLSYLIEAREAARGDALVAAQQSLIQLADLFPGSRYAPIALWEAAIHAEQRGTNDALREAITILERLVDEYPRDGLVFYSRLKQGDILRRLNDFGTARILYERLLRSHSGHPERFRAEMSRADCLLAAGAQDKVALEDALIAYERLALAAGVPDELQAEAIYKLATVYRLQGDLGEYQAQLWILRDRYLREGSAPLGSRGRYWLGKGLLELAGHFERIGDSSGALRVHRILKQHQLPGAVVAARRIEQHLGDIP